MRKKCGSFLQYFQPSFRKIICVSGNCLKKVRQGRDQVFMLFLGVKMCPKTCFKQYVSRNLQKTLRSGSNLLSSVGLPETQAFFLALASTCKRELSVDNIARWGLSCYHVTTKRL